MEKLDLNKLDDEVRNFALRFIDVLKAQDPSRIEEHFELARTSPSGIYDDQYFAVPSAFTLLTYGKPGLDYLYELAKLSSYGSLWAPEALMAVALRLSKPISGSIIWIKSYLDEEYSQRVIHSIETHCSNDENVDHAKYLLFKLIGFWASDSSHHLKLASLFASSSLFFKNGKGFSLIIELLVRSTIRINDELCDQFASLIEQKLDEGSYQDFLERNPAILDPLAASIIPQQRLGSEFKCDFVIKRLDDEYVVVEIEKPQDVPFANKKNPKPSTHLSRPLGQILSWLSWLEDHREYANAHFPGIHSPQGLIVVGRKNALTNVQLRMLKALNDNLSPRIRIQTYDDILENARNIARNLTSR